jgi:hypothetical protein
MLGGADNSYTVPASNRLAGGSYSWAPDQYYWAYAPIIMAVGHEGPPMGILGVGSGSSTMLPPLTTFSVGFAADAYEDDDVAGEAKDITVNDIPQSHTFDIVPDQDWMRLTITDLTAKYNIETDYSGMGDFHVRLYDSGFALMGDLGEGVSDYTFPATGLYYLQAYDSLALTGNYDISVYTTATPAGDSYETDDDYTQSSVIAVGTFDPPTQIHSIHTATDVDWIRFSVTDTSLAYMIGVERDWSSSEVELTLYEQDGVTPITSTTNSSLTYDAFAATGAYYVRIAPQIPGNTGWYEVFVCQAVADPFEVDDDHTQAGDIMVVTEPEGGPSNPWQEHTLHSATDEDWVRFLVMNPTEGYQVDVNEMWWANMVTEIYDQDGVSLLASGGEAVVYSGFPSAGYYYARAYSATGDKGFYYLRVLNVKPDQYEPDDGWMSAKEIEVYECHDRTLHDAADVDYITFNITDTLPMYRIDGDGALPITVTVYDTDGTTILAGPAVDEVFYTFPSPGYYYASYSSTGPTTNHLHVRP